LLFTLSCSTKKNILRTEKIDIRADKKINNKQAAEYIEENFTLDIMKLHKESPYVFIIPISNSRVIDEYEITQKIFNPKVDFASFTIHYKDIEKISNVKVKFIKKKNKSGNIINSPEILFEDIFYPEKRFNTFNNIRIWWEEQYIGVSGLGSEKAITNFNLETDLEMIVGIYDLLIEIVYPEEKIKQKLIFNNIEVTEEIIDDPRHNQYRNR